MVCCRDVRDVSDGRHLARARSARPRLTVAVSAVSERGLVLCVQRPEGESPHTLLQRGPPDTVWAAGRRPIRESAQITKLNRMTHLTHRSLSVKRRILELDGTLHHRSQLSNLALQLSDSLNQPVHHRIESRCRVVPSRRGAQVAESSLELFGLFHLGVPFLRDLGDFSAQDDDEFFEL